MITTGTSCLFAYWGLFDARAGVVYELLFCSSFQIEVPETWWNIHHHTRTWFFDTKSRAMVWVFNFFAVFVIFRSTMRCVSSVPFIIRSDKKEAFHVFSYSWWKMELLASWENIFSGSTLQQPIRLRYHELSSLKKRSMSFWKIPHFNIIHVEYSSFRSHVKCLLTRGSCLGD